MTIKDLDEYLDLQNEIVILNERLEKLKNNPQSLVFDTVKGSSREKPYLQRAVTVTGISQKSIIAQKQLESILRQRISRHQQKVLEIEHFIDTVEKSDIRQIIDLRYIQGLSWLKTAKRVYGHSSDDRARKALTRYIEKKEKERGGADEACCCDAV